MPETTSKPPHHGNCRPLASIALSPRAATGNALDVRGGIGKNITLVLTEDLQRPIAKERAPITNLPFRWSEPAPQHRAASGSCFIVFAHRLSFALRRRWFKAKITAAVRPRAA